VQIVICQLLICGVEFTKTVMFSWIFIEGLHIHSRLVLDVFVTIPNYLAYHAIAWGR